MSRYRMRIALLSLGVVLGYGSAIARYYRGPSHGQGFFCQPWGRVVGRHLRAARGRQSRYTECSPS